MITNAIHATTRKGIIDQQNPLHFADQLIRQQKFKILLHRKNPIAGRIRKKRLMARRSSGDNNQGIHSSSLALLQERFNQLQKTREMRQERELMRLISEAQERHAAYSSSPSNNNHNNNYCSNSSATMHYHHHQPSMGYDSELSMFHDQQRPSSQLGLSLRPDYSQLNRPMAINNNYGDEDGGASPVEETKSWLFGANLGMQSRPLKFDHDSSGITTSDVDTSLRL